jgi:hypothetical protein
MIISYVLAWGIKEFVGARRKAILLHFLGMEGHGFAVRIAASTDTYDEIVLEKLDKHFELRTTNTLATIKFNNRRRQPGETIEQFYISLRSLADHGSMLKRILSDRFIVGVTDNRIRECLLPAEHGLIVDRAVTLAKQIESVLEQSRKMASSTAAVSASSDDKPYDVNRLAYRAKQKKQPCEYRQQSY